MGKSGWPSTDGCSLIMNVLNRGNTTTPLPFSPLLCCQLSSFLFRRKGSVRDTTCSRSSHFIVSGSHARFAGHGPRGEYAGTLNVNGIYCEHELLFPKDSNASTTSTSTKLSRNQITSVFLVTRNTSAA